jgi:hypothetical protein
LAINIVGMIVNLKSITLEPVSPQSTKRQSTPHPMLQLLLQAGNREVTFYKLVSGSPESILSASIYG